MKNLLMLLVLVLSSVASAESCKQHDWIEETGRTQGGGWIWFPAKNSSSSLSEATLRAEGHALEYLKGECGVVPEKTKFNEKCVEKNGNTFTVHLRAAIHQDQCKSTAKSNTELTRRLLSYQALVAGFQVDTTFCNERTPDDCFSESRKAFKSHNIALALAYADRGCSYGDNYACGYVGYLHFELGNAGDARRYMTHACNKGIEISCKELKDLEDQLKRI